MAAEHQRLTPEERANLVAYLDGELPGPEAEAIGLKLAQSATARREADTLNRAWDLLDLLDRPRASEEFAARTLTQAAAHDGRGDRIASAASGVARKAAVGLGWALAAAVLFSLGYLLTTQVWPNPSARLTRDLSIAESVDAYREVGGIEFLRDLDQAPEFH